MVFIKSLRLKGFKSFHHANVLFKSGFTAIAGPNGSGKSNIIDGIRFAFGETSLKSLRVKNIASLINHSSRQTAVTLTVGINDDEDMEFQRLINSSGKAKYKVNGKTVKRYVMIDLLRKYDLALGERNVIAQGMVQKFVEMGAKDRRQIIDDVAGIAEFDQKKKEAIRELDEVQRRIDDANIVLSEREGYLKELEKEKEDALKYREAEGMFKRARGSLIHIQLDKADSQLNKLMRKYVDLKKQKNQYSQEINVLQGQISELSRKKEEVVEQINKDSEHKEYTEKLEKIRVQINVDSERIIVLEKEIAQVTQDIKNLADENQSLQNRFDDRSRNLWKLEKELKELQVKLRMFEKIDDGHDDEDKEDLQLDNYMKKERQLIETQGSLQASLNGLKELMGAYADKGVSADDLLKLKSEMDEIKQELKSVNSSADELFEKEKKYNRELPDLDRKVLDLREKMADLKPMIGKRVSPVLPFIENMKGEIKGIHGPVIDLIEFDNDLADAVSASSGGRLYYVVVDNIDVASKVIKQLKARKLGRATFIPLDKIKSRSILDNKIGMGNIVNYIRSDYDSVVNFVFGNTVLIKNMDEARLHINKYRMVTVEGELFDTSGAITGGKNTSILSAQKKYDNLQKEFESVKAMRDSIYTNLSSLREHMSSKRRERGQLEVRLKSIETELKMYDVNVDDKVSNVQDKIIAQQKELEDVKGQLGTVEQKISDIKNNIDQNKQKRRKKLSSMSKQKDELTEKLTELKSEVASLKKEKNMLLENLEGIKTRKGLASNSLVEKKDEKELLKQRIKKNETVEEKLSVKIKEISKEMQVLWDQMKQLDGQINKLSSDKGTFERKMERISGELDGFEVQKASLETRLGDLKGEYEEYKGYEIIDAGENRLQEIMQMYETILEKLGNVNLKAPEIYDEKKKEMDEIKQRITKLNDEKKAVYRMIDEIEQHKKNSFMEVFHNVNNKFKEIYSHLLRGQAELVLDNEDDPFESGLRIKISRNNKVEYLEQLSGGERTLLSIVLILSIQMVKPSPIYLMDEVDASLDKENSKLLTKLLQDMSKKSQFLVVTHSDEVLKGGDVVLGVSRDQKGNSKVIGLKLKEIDDVVS